VLGAQAGELRLVGQPFQRVRVEDREHEVRLEGLPVVAQQLDHAVGVREQQLRTRTAGCRFAFLGERDQGGDHVLVAGVTAQLDQVTGDRPTHRLDPDLGDHGRDDAVLLVEGTCEGMDSQPRACEHEVEGRTGPARTGGGAGGGQRLIRGRHGRDPTGA
jgi:hypothetical protein